MTLPHTLLHLLAGRAVERAVMRGFSKDGRLPVAPNGPSMLRPGENMLRVRLVGGGIVRSIGVTSAELGLAGHLSRLLQASLGRGVSIDAWGQVGADLHDMAPRIRPEGAPRPHVRVVLIGIIEAFRLRPVSQWRKDLELLAPAVAAGEPPLVVALPPSLPVDLPVSEWVRRRVSASIARLNEETAAWVSRHPGATLAPPQAQSRRKDLGTSEDYARTAGAIAPVVVEAVWAAGA